MDSFRQELKEDYFKHIFFIENILKAGIKSGILRSLPPREMAAALSHLIRAASIDWMIMPTSETLAAKKILFWTYF